LAEGNFKKSILAELRPLADASGFVDLKPLVRSYVSGLWWVHDEARKLLQSKIDSSEKKLLRAIKAYERRYGTGSGSMVLVAGAAEDSGLKFLLPELIENRKQLVVWRNPAIADTFISSLSQVDCPKFVHHPER